MPTASVSTKLTVRKLSARIGAVVSGLGPDLVLDPGTVTAVREALNEHKALVFRDVDLDDEGQQRFAAYFGQITAAHPTVPAVDGEPNVLPVASYDGPANYWHTDVTFVFNPPPPAALRDRAGELPAGRLGAASADAVRQPDHPALCGRQLRRRAPAAEPRHRGRRHPGRHRRPPELLGQGRRLPLLARGGRVR